MTKIIDGNDVGNRIKEGLAESIQKFSNSGVTPSLATILMSDDSSSETYVSMKQRACEEVGINGIDIEIDSDAPETELFNHIDELNDDPSVHGILVQMPVPYHINKQKVLRRIHPKKDVDGFHPENVGRLVAGNPRFIPCTPHGIQKLLATANIDPSWKDIVIVGRSNIVGKPLANLLIQKSSGGNATVTVCHSRTKDLEKKTSAADVVVAAVGVPKLIDGSMLSEDTVVVDVGVNRIEANTSKGYKLIGDVDFKSAKEKATAITPVPGGVGPMTIAMLLYNTVKACSLQENISVELEELDF